MIFEQDCRDVLPKMPAHSIDAVVCDPPYELKRDKRASRGFMHQSWDADSGAFDASTWAEVARVAKPGAWVAAFGGRRTWHHLALAIEDGGLEIRDTLLWGYTTGNVTAKDTTLKPVFEPIVLAQVPSKLSLARTVEEHGTGYLNIDDSRIPYLDEADLARTLAKNPGRSDLVTSGVYGTGRAQQKVNVDGRHPSNIIIGDPDVLALLGDSQRFMVFPKASRKERDLGLDAEGSQVLRNPHTAVKPVAIMEWLIGLLCPVGGTVLDPWIGSGTTGVAAAHKEREIVGIERESIYAEVARLRVAHADLAAVSA